MVRHVSVAYFMLSCGVAYARNQGDRNTMMEYVEVCNRENECKNFSRLVMGTDHLAHEKWTGDDQEPVSSEKIFNVSDEAAKHGINLFDSSPIYVGDIENKLGSWIKAKQKDILNDDFYMSFDLNPDRKLYTLSKGGFPFDLHWVKNLDVGSHSQELKKELVKIGCMEEDPDVLNSKPIPLHDVPAGTYASRLFGDTDQIIRRVSEELGHSMRNLQDDITIYLMHRDDGDSVQFKEVDRLKSPVSDMMHALSSPHLAKGFWTMGWSNWNTARVYDSLHAAQNNRKLAKPTINSQYFSLFEMSERSIHALGVQVTHKEMMDPSFQQGIKIMPYSPLGGFSIVDKEEPTWEKAKRSAREKYEKRDAYWQNVFHAIFTPENEARWYRAKAFLIEFNRRNAIMFSIDQLLNAYVLAHPRTDMLVIGPLSPEQVRRTVEALKFSKLLTVEDLEYLHAGKT